VRLPSKTLAKLGPREQSVCRAIALLAVAGRVPGGGRRRIVFTTLLCRANIRANKKSLIAQYPDRIILTLWEVFRCVSFVLRDGRKLISHQGASS
jgi:hypothetical protein